MKYKISNTVNSNITIRGFTRDNSFITIKGNTSCEIDSINLMVNIEKFHKMFPTLTVEKVNILNTVSTSLESVDDNLKNKNEENNIEDEINEDELNKLCSLSKKRLIEECNKLNIDNTGNIKELAKRLYKAGIHVLEG